MTILRIALRNYKDFEDALAEEARLFEEMHSDVRVELVSVSIHELYRSTLTEGGLREGRFDIALLVTDWLSEGLGTGALEDLDAVAKPVSDSRLAQWLGTIAGPSADLRRKTLLVAMA